MMINKHARRMLTTVDPQMIGHWAGATQSGVQTPDTAGAQNRHLVLVRAGSRPSDSERHHPWLRHSWRVCCIPTFINLPQLETLSKFQHIGSLTEPVAHL